MGEVQSLPTQEPQAVKIQFENYLKNCRKSGLESEIFEEYFRENTNRILIFNSKNKPLFHNKQPSSTKKIFLEWFKNFKLDTLSFSNDIETFLDKNLSEFYNTNTSKFKELLTLSGPPSSIRKYTWLAVIKNKLKCEMINKEAYNCLLSKAVEQESQNQIQKDLHRTFTNCINGNEKNQKLLNNILKAYCVLDKDMTYCQGMNFIAKFVLEFTKFNEFDSFILLYYTLREVRGFFEDDFPLLRCYTEIFKYFFSQKFQKLKDHFNDLEVPYELWVSKWIQTVFTLGVQRELSTRIWDTLIANTFAFIIPISLAIISCYEETLLSFKDSSEVILFFREIMYPKSTGGFSCCRGDYFEVDEIIKTAYKMYNEISNEMDNQFYRFMKSNRVKFESFGKNSFSTNNSSVINIVDNIINADDVSIDSFYEMDESINSQVKSHIMNVNVSKKKSKIFI